MITFRLVVCTKCKLFNFNTDYRQISDFLYHKNNNSFRYKQFHNKMRIAETSLQASSNLKPSDPRSFLCILYNIVSCHRVEHFFFFRFETKQARQQPGNTRRLKTFLQVWQRWTDLVLIFHIFIHYKW